MIETVMIIGTSYNLGDWEKNVIKQARYDNPSFTVDELSEVLGISRRTLDRKLEEYKLNLTDKEKKLILESWKKPT